MEAIMPKKQKMFNFDVLKKKVQDVVEKSDTLKIAKAYGSAIAGATKQAANEFRDTRPRVELNISYKNKQV